MKLGFLLQVGERIVPGLARLDGAGRDRVRAIVEHPDVTIMALADRVAEGVRGALPDLRH